MATGESRRAPVFNLRAGRGRRGRIPGSRCNRKLKHERSQSSNKPAPPPSRYTPGKGRRRRRRRGGEGQEDISPLHSPGPFFSSPRHLSHANEVSHLLGHSHCPPHARGLAGVGDGARHGSGIARRGQHPAPRRWAGRVPPIPPTPTFSTDLPGLPSARPLGALPARQSPFPNPPPPQPAGTGARVGVWRGPPSLPPGGERCRGREPVGALPGM